MKFSLVNKRLLLNLKYRKPSNGPATSEALIVVDHRKQFSCVYCHEKHYSDQCKKKKRLLAAAAADRLKVLGKKTLYRLVKIELGLHRV